MPAANRHPPAVETRRLPQHTHLLGREFNSQNRESSAATDGSLLFIVQIQHERHNAGNGTNGSNDSHNHLRNMYRLPRKEIPVRAFYIPPFRSTRDGRQPSFTAHRLQRRKKLDLDGGLPLMFYYTEFCRFVKQITAKMGSADFG